MLKEIETSRFETSGGWTRSVLWRVRQFGQAISSRSDAVVDAELERLLACDRQWALLARLTPFDRAHHLRVFQLLVESGHDDADLLRAALLHDVGKADERGRVNVVHRMTHVLLDQISPVILEVLAVDRGWFRHGVWLSVHHASFGAALASDAGATERCCRLIATHHGLNRDGDPLRGALRAADEAAIR